MKMMKLHFFCIQIVLLISLIPQSESGLDFSKEKIRFYREKVRSMFYHAYNGYLNYAYPYDELQPLSCTGTDTWGSFSLTLIDALDTLIVMGNHSEFLRATKLVLETINFDANVNVSVFETNIRVVGGLLSAHMLSGIAGVPLEAGWPCAGPLLSLAERTAQKLLPAFNSMTGMPYGTVNLRYGVHRFETPITCTAGVGTYLLEFAALSRLTGDYRYERIALKAMKELWRHRSALGLVGNHINVNSGEWTATDAGIGAGVDSYFEYLIKGGILLQKPALIKQFTDYRDSIEEHMKQDDWFFWVSMTKGTVTMPVFQSLEAFWPGALSLMGDVDSAMRILLTYRQVLKQYGFTPEFYNVPNMEAVNKRSGYPLRPELIESTMYLYRATGDPQLLQIGVELIEAIEHSTRTKCGYATVQNVKDHTVEDRMESFFLAETTKYLYLLFDPDNFIHNSGESGKIINTPGGKCVVNSGGYIFNTEAHPIDPSILYCCSNQRKEDLEKIHHFEENIDFLDLMGLGGEKEERVSEEFEMEKTDLPPDVIHLADPSLHDPPHTSSASPYDDIEYGYDDSQQLPMSSESIPNDSHVGSGGGVEAANDDFDSNPAQLNLDRPKLSDDEGLEMAAAVQKLIDAQAQSGGGDVTVPKLALGPKGKVKYDSSADFSETVVQALQSVLDDWKSLISVSTTLEDIRNNIRKLRGEGYCDPLVEENCPKDYCRIIDRDTGHAALNLMLNMVYGKQRKLRRHSFCLPGEEPKESDNYRNSVPTLKADEYDEHDVGTVSKIGMNQAVLDSFQKLGETNFKLMSCPSFPFLSRFTGLGQVVPPS